MEESHKDILFTDWDSWLNQEERETMIATTTTNIIIEAINENLHGANLVTKCIPGFLTNVKQLKKQRKRKR